MRNTKEIGSKGEKIACNFLMSKGYKVIFCNYYSKYGEIDIIAKKEKYIVFVEVKMRKENSAVRGTFAVDRNKQKRIAKTAMMYLALGDTGLQPRFDVIEIISNGRNKDVKINHIENAFFAEEADSFEII